jgi:hypothetical protein
MLAYVADWQKGLEAEELKWAENEAADRVLPAGQLQQQQ